MTGQSQQLTRTRPESHAGPRGVAAFRSARTLIAVYLGISAITLVAIVLLRDDPAVVTVAVWIRGTIVVASAVVMLLLALAAGRGSTAAYLRLRIVSVIVFVAIVVIIAIPGTFPLWMKLEQALCGAVLLVAVALLNSRAVRLAFAALRPLPAR
jgi:hypothetical protein